MDCFDYVWIVVFDVVYVDIGGEVDEGIVVWVFEGYVEGLVYGDGYVVVVMGY